MQNFINYLTNKNLSKKSLKNYKSDINHFTSWLIMKVRTYGSFVESLEETLPFLSQDTASEYREYLEKNKIPLKTINRRLATLRHFSNFLIEENLITYNFMDGIQNKKHHKISKDNTLLPLVNDFKAYLIGKKVSESTVKNYTSDVKQFINWLEKNPAYAKS